MSPRDAHAPDPDTPRRTARFGGPDGADGLDVAWDARVLEPRPWTALQSRWAAELVGPGRRLLEICSGAGQIGLLAAHLSGCDLVAVDVDPVACGYTTANASAAGLAGRVQVRQAPGAQALVAGELFDAAVVDPPWVPSAEVGRFPDDPLLAIDGGPDGLDLAHELVAAVRGHLHPGGSLLLQLGDDAQADLLLTAAAADGWRRGAHRHGERGVVVQLLHP